MFRYVALVWDSHNITQQGIVSMLVRRLREQPMEWSEADSSDGLRVLHAGAQSGIMEALPLDDRRGVLLGTIFERSPDEAVSFDSAPIVVINTADKGIVVLSRVCTHLGCLVEYSRAKQKLLCPCHAGTYNIDGSTAGGPPPKPLTAIPYRIDGDNIILG